MKIYTINLTESQKNLVLASLIRLEHEATLRNNYQTRIDASMCYALIAEQSRIQDKF